MDRAGAALMHHEGSSAFGLTLQVLREDEDRPVMKREEPSPAGSRGEARTTESIK